MFSACPSFHLIGTVLPLDGENKTTYPLERETAIGLFSFAVPLFFLMFRLLWYYREEHIGLNSKTPHTSHQKEKENKDDEGKSRRV